MDKASKNFDWSELECKCGCGTRYVNQKAIDTLQSVRDQMGMVLVVNSAARCVKHNAAVGGKAGSKHLSYKVEMNGKIVESTAFDISLNGVDQAKLIKAAKEAGFNGIGVAKSFIHMDIRDVPASWVY